MRRTPIHVTYEFVGDPRPDAAKIDELARMIVRQDIFDFYADPKNQAAFEAWKAKKAAAEAAQSQC